MKKELQQALFFQNSNQLQEALEIYEKQASLEHSIREYVLIYGNMANIYFTNNQCDKAIKFYKKALEYEQNNQSIVFNLGVAFLRIEKYEESKTYLKKSLSLNKSHYPSWLNLAICYKNLEEYQNSFDTFSKALLLNPLDNDLYYNLGNLYLALEHYSYALKYYFKVLKRNKEYVKALYSIGLCYHKILKNKRAIGYFDRALAYEPNYYDCLFAKSLALLQTENFVQGWELYQYRFEAKNSLKKPQYKVQFLNNQEVKDKIILVQGEQGYGDNLQFCRYLKYLKGAKKIYFAVREPLKELMQNSFKECVVCTHEDILNDVEYFVSLMDLPRIFSNKNIFSDTTFPYIVSKKNNLIDLPKKKLHVGFCWEGNAEHCNNHNRSIPLSYFIDFIQENKDINFYSLQKQTEEILPSLDNLIDLSPTIKDFSNTASIIEQLDCIVSIDSALIHLSGALNKKSFLLLPKYCEFRWGEKGENSWYKSVTLLRQHKQGFWDNVMIQLRNNFSILLKQEFS